MRQQLIDAFNDIIETDHDTFADVMLKDFDLSLLSPLYEQARTVRGVKVVTAIDVINSCLDKPIEPVIEDGVIQGFK